MYAGENPPEPSVHENIVTVESYARMVNQITAVLAKRQDWREQLERRARTVERDIEAWVAQTVAEIVRNPWIDFPVKPPNSMFDVEPPF